MKTVLFLGNIYRVDDSVGVIQAETIYANHGREAVAYAIYACEPFDKNLLGQENIDASIDRTLLSIEAHDATKVLDFLGAARYFYRTDNTDEMHQLCKETIAIGHPWWFDADYLAVHAGLKTSEEMWRIIRSYSNPPSRLFQIPVYHLVLEIPGDTAIVAVEEDGTIVAIDDIGKCQQIGWTKLISQQRFDARRK